MQKFPVWDDHSSCARPLIHSTTTPNPALARKLQSNTDPNVSYAGNTANIPGSAPSTTGGNDVRSCTSVERRYIPCDRHQLRINCTKHTHHQLRKHEQDERRDAVPRCRCGAEGPRGALQNAPD